jgi:kinesin family protein C2/C3
VQLEAQLVAVTAQVAMLEHEGEASAMRLLSAEAARADAAAAAATECTAAHASAEKSNEEAALTLAAVTHQHTAVVAALTSAADGVTADRDRLLEELARSLADREADAARSGQRLATADAEVDRLRLASRACEEEVRTAQQAASEATVAMGTAAAAHVVEMDAQKAQLEVAAASAVSALERTIAAQSEQLAEHRAAATAHNDELTRGQRTAATAAADLARATLELEQTKQALSATSVQMAAVQVKVGEGASQLLETRAELEAAAGTVVRLTAELQAATSAAATAEQRADELETKINVASATLTEKVDECATIQATCERLAAEHGAVVLAADAATAAHGEAVASLASTKELLEGTVATLATVSGERDRTSTALHQTEAEVVEMTHRLTEMTHQLAVVEAARTAGEGSERTTQAALAARTDELHQVRTKLETLLASDLVQSLRDVKALYVLESRERKQLRNRLRELEGNIRVVCRVRHDARVSDESAIFTTPDQDERVPSLLMCPFLGHADQMKKYEFDRVFASNATQEQVYTHTTEPMVTAVLDGYNVAIISYGQTGTGKTHTMVGTDADPGISVRSIDKLLGECAKKKGVVDHTVSVSMMEVYMDNIIDLLSEEPAASQSCGLKGGVVVGLEQRLVRSTEEVVATMADGARNRKVASTAMNSASSRSHLLVCITIDSTDRVTGASTSATLTLVDLAGSERYNKAHGNGGGGGGNVGGAAQDVRDKQKKAEMVSINKSLAALGQVFESLHAGASHVPYRNSKLTHVMKDMLSKDAKVCVFVHVSPDEAHLGETVSTLNFGTKISTIEHSHRGPSSSKGPTSPTRGTRAGSGGSGGGHPAAP